MIWASSQSFCTKLIFAKKLQSFMTPLNEWFGLQTSTIAMILYQFCVRVFCFFFFNKLLFYLQIWQMTAWRIVAIEWGQLKKVSWNEFFSLIFWKNSAFCLQVWCLLSVLKKINIELKTYLSITYITSVKFIFQHCTIKNRSRNM